MTEPTAPQMPPGERANGLAAYFRSNRGSFTDEALKARASEAGYSTAEVEEALASSRGADLSLPLRRRARSIVLGAYLITYAVLAYGTFTTSYAFGAGQIGTVILTIAMGLTAAISLAIVRRSRRTWTGVGSLAPVLAVPLILLVIVAGLCVASGYPFHQSA